MEVGVRLIGLILRLLNFLLAPVFWFRARDRRRVPPLKNTLLLKSATQIAAGIRNGELTSEEVVRAYVERIQEVNIYLNAVVDERYRAAIEEAKDIDRKIAEAKDKGSFNELVASKPLLGVPFTVKESCSLLGLSNAVGCLENAGSRATSDGEAVALVKAAGAIALLVSNTPELCLGWETTNLLRGTTNNPYDLNRTPGGSSGGESALLACGASCFGVASDIAGSIRIPAAFCGVFGHKPTPGIISIQGHIPMLADELYPKFLTVGPMARRAEDLPLLLSVMAGKRAEELDLHSDVDLRNLKVHYMLESTKSPALLTVEPSITSMVLRATHYLQTSCGATVSEEKFVDLEDSVEILISVFFSMKDIPNMLQDPANPKQDKSLGVELLKYIFGGGSRSLQGLGFTLISRNQLFIPQSRRPYYIDKARRLKEQITNVLGSTGVLLWPVFGGAAPRHGQALARAAGAALAARCNVLGLPATAVPLGLHRGLPLALQVIAAPFQDRLCLAVARKLEEGFGGWRPPHCT